MKEFATVLGLFTVAASQAVIHVNFDTLVNARLSTLTGGNGYPPNGGMLTLGGIEHRIAVNGSNESACMFVANETKIVPVNSFGVAEVYTIINSGYGAFGQPNGQVEIHGSGGLVHTIPLMQGDNIRDHYNGNYNNSAPNVNATHNFSTGVRMDQQKIVLPVAFQAALLTEIRLVAQNNVGLNGTPMLQSVSLVEGPMQTLTGTVILNDTVGTFAAPRQITYSVISNGNVSAMGSIRTGGMTSASYAFTIPVPAAVSGTATLRLDGSSFLQKSVEISLTGTTTDAGTISLNNGDSDHSGEVDAADIDLVIADFGSAAVADTDVDVSGEVDAADIDIVIANFGLGDE